MGLINDSRAIHAYYMASRSVFRQVRDNCFIGNIMGLINH